MTRQTFYSRVILGNMCSTPLFERDTRTECIEAVKTYYSEEYGFLPNELEGIEVVICSRITTTQEEPPKKLKDLV